HATFDPKVNAQQPDQVSVPADGGAALKGDGKHKQRRPNLSVPHVGKDASAGRLAARPMTRGEVLQICAANGLDAASIEARVLEGETVRVQGWSLRANDEGAVELLRPDGRGRTASLMDLDRVIADLQAQAALRIVRQAAGLEAPEPVLGYTVRPL